MEFSSKLNLSIIVPCYNVYPYIKDCLKSLVNVNYPKQNLEILLIDDGSTDKKTPLILKQYADKYSFIKAYRKKNGGAASARNLGMKKAQGQYITFVDGDDTIPVNAYSNLMNMAFKSHANIVSGFMRRFDNTRNQGSYLHKFAIRDTLTNTNVRKDLNLLYDTTSPNKVYKHSFLRKYKLQMPTTLLYEDLPFVLEAYLDSNHNATITNNVYNWRWRDTSITNSRSQLNNLKSRLSSLKLCKKELLAHGFGTSSLLYHAFSLKILRLDLHIFLENIGDSTTSYIENAQKLIFHFLTNWKITKTNFSKYTPNELKEKLSYTQYRLWSKEHCLNHDYPQTTDLLHSWLIKLLPIKDQVLYLGVLLDNFKLLTQFTYMTDRQILTLHHKYYGILNVPKRIQNKITFNDNVPINQRLVNIHDDTDKHIVYGYGMLRMDKSKQHIKMLSSYKLGFTDVKIQQNEHEILHARLINIDNNKSYSIHISRAKTPGYKRIFKPKTSWTKGRYIFWFNYVQAQHALGYGTWVLRANGKWNQYTFDRLLGQPQHEKASTINLTGLNDKSLKHKQFFTQFRPDWSIEFVYKPITSQNYVLSNAHLDKKSAHLIIQCNHKLSAYVMPAFIYKNKMLAQGYIKNVGNHSDIVFDLSSWSVQNAICYHSLKLLDNRDNYKINYIYKLSSKKNYRILSLSSHKCILCYLSKYKTLRLAMINTPVVLSNLKQSNNDLSFDLQNVMNRTCFVNNMKNDTGHLVAISSNKKHRCVLNFKSQYMRFNHGTLHVTLNLTHMLKGKYTFTLYWLNKKYMNVAQLNLPSHKLDMADYVYIKNTKPVETYKYVQGRHGQFDLKIGQPWTGWNKSLSHRALDYTVLYPLLRLLPLKKNTMVFDAYWGHQFSSNERALYNYVQKYLPQYKCYWLMTNDRLPITGKGEEVRKYSLKYWYVLARSKYLFQNTNLPNQYLKRAKQVEIETLHGTFLKHMGFDEPQLKYGSVNNQQKFAKRIRRWDYMITPSNYMKRTAGHAFNYHQKWLKTGFPRNDDLFKHNNKAYISQIKNKLHIPKSKKVILYAPTYRKNDKEFHLDLKHLHHVLGDNYLILVRLHYFVANSHSFYQYPTFVKDVSTYSNINDLFLISNALITDYSSVMFDYSCLNLNHQNVRPIIYYAYDYQDYLNNKLRGTYLDYQHAMPGPIVTNQHDLEHVLVNLTSIQHQYADKLVAFAHKFAQFGTKGNATARVIHKIINTDDQTLKQKPDKNVIFHKFWHWFRIYDFQSNLLNYLSQKLPKKNIIIFESFFGTKYSDNPKALYLYIKKHYPKYKCYWNINAKMIPYFERHHIPYVTRFGYHGLLKQAEAKYWIVNSRRPFRWIPSKDTTVLQTWHGTPLKTLGADVEHVTMPNNNAMKYHRQVYMDNRRWNYLLVPNDYAMHIMPRAFRMRPGQIINNGYPRNDILVNHANDTHMQNHIKKLLHIPLNKKVILYAPTWRDNEYLDANEYIAHIHLDLAKMQKHYGNKAVVLVRTHYMIGNHLNLSKYKGFVINVSNWQDINQLYLISDVLITDYSSVMFDYAILNRPIIFYDYDYNQYADVIRGFYFNFKKLAPGAIVTTTNQVIQQLDNIFKNGWKPNKKYQAFRKKFDQNEDGHNSKRVAEFLLGKEEK